MKSCRDLVWGEDNYFRIDRHYLDEGQFGGVPIDAPLNYKRGYGGGVENTLTYNLPNLSLRLNVFVVARRRHRRRDRTVQLRSGASWRILTDTILFSITRRWSAVPAAIAYRWRDYLFTFDGLFSSGLRGGFANQDATAESWQFNLSASRFFHIPKLGQVENRIILLNIFDRTNLIRPAEGIGVSRPPTVRESRSTTP